MKKLRLPCAYLTKPGLPPIKDGLTFYGEKDGGAVQVTAKDTGNIAHNFINREQAEALVAHLTAVFGLSKPETTPVNPYVIYED